MPEVTTADKPVHRELTTKIYTFMSQDRLIPIIEANNLEFIARGGESIVVSTPEHPERVTAFAYGTERSPELAKKQFYYQRIMETLFPHNFPHFYAAFSGTYIGYSGETEVPLAGTVRKRIMPQRRTMVKGFGEKLGVESIKFPFSKVIEGCLQMGIPIDEMQDREHGRNLMVGEDGGEYYVDNLAGYYDAKKDPDSHNPLTEPFIEPFVSSRNKIVDYMQNNGYKDNQKKLVSLCIDRIQAAVVTGKASKPKVA